MIANICTTWGPAKGRKVLRASPSRSQRTSCSPTRRPWQRKIREAILAFRIEDDLLSKERILELYLNEIYLGSRQTMASRPGGAQLLRSNRWTSSRCREIAYLAALPKAPNRYNLVRNEKEALCNRRDYVLTAHVQEDGYITVAEDAEAARAREAGSFAAAAAARD